MARFQALATQVTKAWDQENAGRVKLAPEDVIQGMRRIETALGDSITTLSQEAAAEASPQRQRLTELTELTIELLGELATLASDVGLDQAHRDALLLPAEFALWAARRGANIHSLGPVVDALARLANSTREPVRLAQLFQQIGQLMDAVAPAARSRDGAGRASSPWRALLMNRAIVATRSLDPGLMAQAFDTLVEQLPEDAPGFFAEGMNQLDIIGYPPQVREVMTRYYAQFGPASDTLHRPRQTP